MLVRRTIFILCYFALHMYVTQGAGYCADNPAESDPPRIVIEILEHDFGNLKEGEQRTADFQYKNTGGRDLEIKKILTACGCTVGHFEGRNVKPGKSGILHITFDSEDRIGEQRLSVKLLTNDPNRRVVELFISANVMNALRFKPKKLGLHGRPGELVRREITLINDGDSPVRLLKVTSSRPEFRIDNLPKNIVPHSELPLTIAIRIPNGAVESLSGRLTLHTRLQGYKEINLTVMVSLPGKKSQDKLQKKNPMALPPGFSH